MLSLFKWNYNSSPKVQLRPVRNQTETCFTLIEAQTILIKNRFDYHCNGAVLSFYDYFDYIKAYLTFD
jgi:hypothetical protein